MTRVFNIVLAVLVLIVGIPTWWLLFQNDPGDAQPMPVTIAQLRQLAESGEGARPVAIRYEDVGGRWRTRNFVLAGYGFRWHKLNHYAYALEFPDGQPAMIGAGVSPEVAKQRDFADYHPDAQRSVVRSVKSARLVIPLDATNLQRSGLDMLAEPDQAQQIERELAIPVGETPRLIAPGIVSVPAPEIGEKVQMVYVLTEDGKQFLFPGSIAPVERSWTRLNAPARIVTSRFRKIDREALYRWLATIKRMHDDDPSLIVIPGHRVPEDAGLIEGMAAQSDPLPPD